MASNEQTPVLEVKGLQTSFFTPDGEVKAVDGVDFSVNSNETLGIVGESGSGKSITSLSVMRLIQHPGKIVGGTIELSGEDLLKKSKQQFAKYRGNRLSMIFQEPMTSLNQCLQSVLKLLKRFVFIRNSTKKQHGKKQLTC